MGPDKPSVSSLSLPLPRPVFPGARLAIVAPAGPFEVEAFQAGLNWLSQRYEVVHRDDIYSRQGYFAGSDARRLNELVEAIDDPTVDAIVCARGGYGCTRLLPRIDLEAIQRANKTLVGFSDITALHVLWSSAGVRSIHAPMVASLGRASETVREIWIDALEQPDRPLAWDLGRLNENAAEAARGPLVGGNLTVLATLLGTEHQPDLAGRILFLEDVGERPYRIDRVLTSMRQAGLFDEIAGLVLGAFTEGEPGPDGVTLEGVLQDHFGMAPFPVLHGFPAGHVDENEALPLGATAQIRGPRLEILPRGEIESSA